MGDYDMLANDKTGVNTGFIGAFEDIGECAAIARDFRPEPITARPSNAGRVSLTPEQMLAAHQNLQALMEARALYGSSGFISVTRPRFPNPAAHPASQQLQTVGPGCAAG